MIDVYSRYKRFRNYIRKTNIEDSFEAIYLHDMHIEYNKELSERIFNAPSSYRRATSPEELIQSGVYAWKLEIMLKEVVLNSSPYVYRNNKSLRDWVYFARTSNAIKDLEGEISKKFITEDNGSLELNRLIRNQAQWSRRGIRELIRYWKIYNHSSLDKIVQHVFQLPMTNYQIISYCFFGTFLKTYKLKNPPIIEISELKMDDLIVFLDHFSIPFDELKQKLQDEQDIDDKFFYSFNPLKKYPLIRFRANEQEYLMCPMPSMLIARITSGLYYELNKVKGFDQAFGKAFEEYIGEVVKKTNQGFDISPEITYGKDSKKSSDWIVSDSSATFFVECKAKRFTLKAKTSLSQEDNISQLIFLAEFVVQIYKVIRDFRENEFESPFQVQEPIIPVVVTLEDWDIHFPSQYVLLSDLIKEELNKESIPNWYLDEFGFIVCSCSEFEILFSVLSNEKTLSDVIKPFLHSEKFKGYKLEGYLAENFTDIVDYEPIFDNEFEEALYQINPKLTTKK